MNMRKYYIYEYEALRKRTKINGKEGSLIKLNRPIGAEEHEVKSGDIINIITKGNIFANKIKIIKKNKDNTCWATIHFEDDSKYEKTNNSYLQSILENVINELNIELPKICIDKLDLSVEYDFDNSLCTYFDVSEKIIDDDKEFMSNFKSYIINTIKERIYEEPNIFYNESKKITFEIYKDEYITEEYDTHLYFSSKCKEKKLIENQITIYRIFFRFPLFRKISD